MALSFVGGRSTRTVQLTTTIPDGRARSKSMSLPESVSESIIDNPRPEIGQPIERRASDPGPSTAPLATDSVPTTTSPAEELQGNLKKSTCGICADSIIVTKTPFYKNTPTSPLTTGINLACSRHTYCNQCLRSYLMNKLEDAGVKMSVFPIRCPECTWWDIPDFVAEVVLCKEELEGLWYWAKVFDEVNNFYCPIGTCGARIELPNQQCSRGLRRAECPSCKESFCFRCQVKWHDGQTCAAYARASGAIVLDKQLQKLAKEHKWRRCPKCRIVVERNLGCRHMSCRCGHQFCYNCGRRWGDGCGRRRSKMCFPLKIEIWPETRSRIAEMARDLFSSSWDAFTTGVRKLGGGSRAASATLQ